MTIALVIEDDQFKADQLTELLRSEWSGLDVRLARSVMSGIRILVDETVELVILDMSLPTYDVGPDEPGGRSQAFGGREVLRYMDRLDATTPVVVVTQYPDFDTGSARIGVGRLREMLEEEHPNTFRGLLFFGATWKTDLKQAVDRILKRA